MADIQRPHTLAIGCGDYLDAVRSHARQHLQEYRARGQDQWEMQDDWATAAYDKFYTKYLEPIRDRLIVLGEGNHYWQYQDQTTSTQHLCRRARVPFGGKPTFIRFKIIWRGKALKTLQLLVHHGDWGGNYARLSTDLGSAENKAIRFGDFDVFIFSHTHRKYAVEMEPAVHLPTTGALKVIERPRVLMRTGCFTRSYTGSCINGQAYSPHYAHRKLMPPTALGYPKVTIQLYRDYEPDRYAERVRHHQEEGRLTRSIRGAGSGTYKVRFRPETI